MNITVKTQHSKSKTYRFVLISFIIVTALFAMAQTPLLTPAFWQGTAVVFFGAVLYVLAKFHLTEYVYTFSTTEFVIVKLSGNKQVKVCHLDTDMMVALYSEKEWKEQKKNRQITCIYNYNAHFSPDKFCVVLFELGSKLSAVKFEASEEMKNAMLNAIRDLKENQ